MKRLLILLMLVSQPAWAEWVKLRTEGPNTYYWDPERVQKTDEGRMAWMLRSRKPEPELITSTLSLWEFDCLKWRGRLLAASHYGGPMVTGERISVNTLNPGRFIAVFPGDDEEQLIKTVCKVPLK
jgi:hypothetical protein